MENILANFLNALAYVLHTVIWIYIILVAARAILSWVNPDPYNPIVRFLYSVTEPVLRPIRRKLPLNIGIDLSPIIVFLALMFIDKFLVASLYDLVFSLKTSGRVP